MFNVYSSGKSLTLKQEQVSPEISCNHYGKYRSTPPEPRQEAMGTPSQESKRTAYTLVAHSKKRQLAVGQRGG